MNIIKMATLQEAAQQTQEARTQVETQRKKISESKKRLEEAKKRLPSRKSARALRSGITAGLNGRQKRVQIRKSEKAIEAQKGKVKEFETGLTEFEEQQLKPAEAQVKAAQEEKAAVEAVQAAIASDNVALVAMYGEGRQKELAQAYVQEKKLATESFTQQVQEFELANPGEKLQVDWKKLQIKGVQSGALGKNIDIKKYNQEIEKLTKTVEEKKIPDTSFTVTGTTPTTLDPVTSQVKKDRTFFQKVKDAFKVTGIGTVSALSTKTKDLKTRDPSKINDINVPSGISLGTSKKFGDKIRTITGNIIGDTSSFEKGSAKAEEIVRPKEGIVSAAQPTDILKGEQFRPQGEIRIERFGTTTPQLPKIEKKSLAELRKEAVILGGRERLFTQEVPVSTAKKVVEFIPIVGQVKPAVTSLRDLSEQQRRLVAAESILGAGQVSQKEFRKSLGQAGLQVGILGLDVAATGAAVKTGVKLLGAEARAVRQLRKAPLEVFIGLEETRGGTSKLLIGGRRQAGKVRAETLTKFDVIKTGEKTAQIQKGKGVQEILKDGERLKRTEFTLFGEAQEVPARTIKKSGELILTKEIKEPTSAFFSEVKILTKGKTPELIKTRGIGLQREVKDITQSLVFPAKKVIQKRATLINPFTERGITEVRVGLPKVKVKTKELDALGVIKKFEKKALADEGGIIILGDTGKTSSTILKTEKAKQIGQSVGLQTESQLLKPTQIKVKPKPLGRTPAQTETQTVQISEPQVITTQTKPVLLERQDIRQVKDLKPVSQFGFREEVKTKTRQQFEQLGKKDTRVAQKVDIIQTQDVGVRQKTTARQLLESFTKQKTKTAAQTPTKKTTSAVKQISFIKPKTKTTGATNIIKSITNGAFKVKVRKGGKDIKIGEAATRQEAKTLLLERLKTTLRASGFVEKGGKKVELGILGEGFRKSKRDPTRVVEIRTKRIKRKGKSQEAKEIQFFRGKASRGGKSGFF